MLCAVSTGWSSRMCPGLDTKPDIRRSMPSQSGPTKVAKERSAAFDSNPESGPRSGQYLTAGPVRHQRHPEGPSACGAGSITFTNGPGHSCSRVTTRAIFCANVAYMCRTDERAARPRTPADVLEAIEAVDVRANSELSELDLLNALAFATDLARYWQPPDEVDVMLPRRTPWRLCVRSLPPFWNPRSPGGGLSQSTSTTSG